VALTPDEIEGRDFSIALRGYEREEVDAFLRQVAADLRDDQAAPPTDPFAGLGDEVATIMRNTVASAQDAKARAEVDAEALRQRTAAECDAMRHSAEQIRRAAEAEAEELRQRAAAEGDEMRQSAEQIRREAEGERDRARREAEEAGAGARQAAEALLAQARDDADGIRSEARHQAAMVTDQARQEAEAIRSDARNDAERILTAAGDRGAQLVAAAIEGARAHYADVDGTAADLVGELSSVEESLRRLREVLGENVLSRLLDELTTSAPGDGQY
jgi:DivIVA domain-containing protein